MVIIIFSVITILSIFRIKLLYSLPSSKLFAPVQKEKKSDVINVPSPSNFLIISDENLFHPDRKIPPEKKIEEAKPLPMPDFILYGTLITDNTGIAYLEDLKDPRNTPGRGKRQISLKIGDSLSGFILKEIYTDKVIMIRGEEKATVSISDSHKRIKSGTKSH
jgi:hypothetical protein